MNTERKGSRAFALSPLKLWDYFTTGACYIHPTLFDNTDDHIPSAILLKDFVSQNPCLKFDNVADFL